jgi:type VI secretion system protein ImpA
MPQEDIASLLQPVSADAPCGPDLEYDPAFLELDRLCQPKPEQQIGNTIVPAQEPDWKTVASRAADLLGKTKDMRVAMQYVRGQLETSGFPGLARGCAVLRGMVEQFWDGFYPLLDPEDGNDPTFRVNILMSVCDQTVVDRIRMLPLVVARSFGKFSQRDLSIASGEQPPLPGVDPPKASSIEGAFNEAPIPDLQATADALKSAKTDLATIENIVGEKVGVDQAPNFSKLTSLLFAMEKILSARLLKRGVGVEAIPGEDGEAGQVGAGGGPAGGRLAVSGQVNSTADVSQLLDKICEYYERCEPSSPLPLLLKRCKRLVSANFLDIVRDLVPDALSQVEALRGRDPEQSQ